MPEPATAGLRTIAKKNSIVRARQAKPRPLSSFSIARVEERAPTIAWQPVRSTC